MLAEIICDKFMSNGKPREAIRFHEGLNVVFGSEAGDNSIGKSTFLMIIDFAFGGNDYVFKSLDVQENVHGHTIKFAFDIKGKKYFFSRETIDHTIVWVCNENYEHLESLRLEEYRDRLLELYGISLYATTFRDIVGRYFRVYGRDNLDEKEPLKADKQEPNLSAIASLMKLFDKFRAVAELKKEHKKKTDEKNAHSKAQEHKFIPKINKKAYTANSKRMDSLAEEMNALQNNADENLMGLDSKEAEIIAELRQKLTNARRNKSRLISQLKSIENDMVFKNAPRSSTLREFEKLQKFFTNADIKQLSEIEQFHSEMTSVLSAEFEAARKGISALIEAANVDIVNFEQKIKDTGITPKISKAVLNSYADKKNEIVKLKNENTAYDTMNKLKVDAKELKTKLDKMQEEQFITVHATINNKMNEINDYIYDGEKNAPVLNITKENSYTFYTPDDTGTGTSYKGLIVFDLSILSLTDLPVVIHDSVALKQIADEPLEKIMELYSKSNKQIFIALDKKSSYTQQTQDVVSKNTILRLSPNGNELFGRSWNEKKEDAKSIPKV